MKRNIFVVVLLSVFFVSCVNSSDKNSTDEKKVDADVENLVVGSNTVAIVDEVDNKEALLFQINKGDFSSLVAYIEKNGFLVEKRDDLKDYQYTFFDKSGNRHALITINRDNDEEALNSTVKQISAWAYYDGLRDKDHFFGYYITPGGVYTFSPKEKYSDKYTKGVKNGYNDLIQKIKE